MKEILHEALSTRGSQARLVTALGVPKSTVSNWARGLNAPEPYRWAAIEEALGMEPGTLAAAGVVMQPADGTDRWSVMEELIRQQGDEIRQLRAVVELLAARPSDAAQPARARSRSTPS
jgi:transcriptional regulator with XRE-family HTH domain